MDNQSEIMFNWGIGLFAFVLLLTAFVQVCYRVQDKSRARVRSEIVRVQQETATAAAGFASLLRPEVLRGLVISVNPKSVPLGFDKTIDINSLKVRE